MTPLMLLPLLLTAGAEDPLAALQAACAHRDPQAALQAFDEGATLRVILDPSPAGAFGHLPEEVYAGRERIRSFLTPQLGGCRTDDAPLARAPDGSATFRWSTGPWREAGAEWVSLTATADLRDSRIFQLTLAADPPSSRALEAGLPQANAARVRRFFELLDRHDLSALAGAPGSTQDAPGVLAEGVIQHSSLPVAPGAAGVRAYYAKLFSAFPDVHFQLDDLLADADRVAVRVTMRATHRGEFMGVEATGRAVVLQRMDVFRFENGLCAEHWDSVDRLGLLQQLGVLAREPRWGGGPSSEGFR